MIELLVLVVLVGIGCGSFGFCFGIVLAGRNAFENGRQQGWREARRPETPKVRVLR